ncbi:MAG: hypothetical protein AABY32_01295 [Nanoarchaeota archaeon]
MKTFTITGVLEKSDEPYCGDNEVLFGYIDAEDKDQALNNYLEELYNSCGFRDKGRGIVITGIFEGKLLNLFTDKEQCFANNGDMTKLGYKTNNISLQYK